MKNRAGDEAGQRQRGKHSSRDRGDFYLTESEQQRLIGDRRSGIHTRTEYDDAEPVLKENSFMALRFVVCRGSNKVK